MRGGVCHVTGQGATVLVAMVFDVLWFWQERAYALKSEADYVPTFCGLDVTLLANFPVAYMCQQANYTTEWSRFGSMLRGKCRSHDRAEINLEYASVYRPRM